jgi:uracil-DNA glycosylase
VANLRAKVSDFLSDWRDDLSSSWGGALDGVEPKLSAIDTALTLENNETIFPGRKGHPAPDARPDSHVFRALDGLRPQDVRAVILGQDPYPRSSRATGRSFEQGDLLKWSPKKSDVAESLRRILQVAAHFRTGETKYLDGDTAWKGLAEDIVSGDVDVEPPQQFFDRWQEQGVLCLNAGLTLSRFEPAVQKAHFALWRPVIQRILTTVATRTTGSVVFLLWGGVAEQTFQQLGVIAAAEAAGTRDRVAVAKRVHPGAEDNAGKPRFFGAPNIFAEANEKLVAGSGIAIEW